MQHSEYAGPTDEDYANVAALNRMFIDARCELTSTQQAHLAATPFLLFSIRERDLEWWRDAMLEQRQQPLIGQPCPPAIASPALRTAAVGFLWQLLQRNPYAARLVSGESIAWCAQIRQYPLVALLHRLQDRQDLILSRLQEDETSGRLMLCNRDLSRLCVGNPVVRRASQIAALQTILQNDDRQIEQALPAAACRLRAPRKVRDKKV